MTLFGRAPTLGPVHTLGLLLLLAAAASMAAAPSADRYDTPGL